MSRLTITIDVPDGTPITALELIYDAVDGVARKNALKVQKNGRVRGEGIEFKLAPPPPADHTNVVPLFRRQPIPNPHAPARA